MNTRNTQRIPLENKDASINLGYDPFQKILENLEQKDEGIDDLKLENSHWETKLKEEIAHI